MSPPSAEERPDVSPGFSQKQMVPPTEVPPFSPGPLLTGRVAVDATLGFLGEIVALALILYGIRQGFLYFTGPLRNQWGFMEMLGVFATAGVLYQQTGAMRERYPSFARGWRLGRDTWAKGVEHLLTLLFGVLMLCVLFPLGGLLLALGLNYGTVAWIGAIAIAYLFGLLARRMSGEKKKKQPGGNLP